MSTQTGTFQARGRVRGLWVGVAAFVIAAVLLIALGAMSGGYTTTRAPAGVHSGLSAGNGGTAFGFPPGDHSLVRQPGQMVLSGFPRCARCAP